jgi:hypothetical protein
MLDAPASREPVIISALSIIMVGFAAPQGNMRIDWVERGQAINQLAGRRGNQNRKSSRGDFDPLQRLPGFQITARRLQRAPSSLRVSTTD